MSPLHGDAAAESAAEPDKRALKKLEGAEGHKINRDETPDERANSNCRTVRQEKLLPDVEAVGELPDVHCNRVIHSAKSCAMLSRDQDKQQQSDRNRLDRGKE